MTATEVSVPRAAEPSPPRRRRRPIGSRIAAGHVVMVAAALLAAVANIAVIRSAEDTVPILVLAEDATAGTPADQLVLRPAQVDLEHGTLATLVVPGDREQLAGRVLAGDVAAGAPLRWSDVPERAAPDGLRRMSIPLLREQAVGGAIVRGDAVDVIQVFEGDARYVVAGAEVLDVAAEADTTLGGLATFYISIAVDPDTALCLARAIDAGQLTVVLSTGQEVVEAAPCAPIADDPAAPDPAVLRGAAATQDGTLGEPAP